MPPPATTAAASQSETAIATSATTAAKAWAAVDEQSQTERYLGNIGNLEDLGLIFALLPGLISYLVVRNLTGREREIEVSEAILQALAYTLLTHALWTICQLPGSWIPTPDIVGLSLCAVVIGAVVSLLTNSGIAFRILRKVNLTSQSEFRSTWETAYKNARKTLSGYAVVELDDGRRVRGAIVGISPEPDNGHICLDRVLWLAESGNEEAVETPGWLLFPACRVNSINYLPNDGV